MGWATQHGPRPRLVATSHRLASCVIVSRFRTALDLDTYPLSNFIRPRCAERAKRGRDKPVLIMHIGFLACFHAISLERSRFSKIATFFSCPCAMKMLVSLISRLVACSPRIVVDKQTDRHRHRTTTVTLAAHVLRGLIILLCTIITNKINNIIHMNKYNNNSGSLLSFSSRNLVPPPWKSELR